MIKNYTLCKSLLKNIIKKKIICLSNEKTLKLNIYYKILKTKRFIMKDNISKFKSIQLLMEFT